LQVSERYRGFIYYWKVILKQTELQEDNKHNKKGGSGDEMEVE
jgi:hypothetical protein